MDLNLEADILAASQGLQVPGSGERRVLTPMAVERLARSASIPRWQVEAQALDTGVTPLHYLRNLGHWAAADQARLLRSNVVVVGSGPALARSLELLGLNGIGRIRVLTPYSQPDREPFARAIAEELAAAARNRNASSEVEAGVLQLSTGNPAASLQGADTVAACLEDSAEEQVLQFACRMRKLPLVLAGVEHNRGQATTVLPGDPGVALVYKPVHPHLEPVRRNLPIELKAGLMVGSWLAEQTTHLLLGNEEEWIRGRLLYADLDTGEMTQYPL